MTRPGASAARLASWPAWLLDFLLLPASISACERERLGRMNRIARVFFALHVPLLMLVAALAGGRVVQAGLLGLLLLAGPELVRRASDNPRYLARVFAVTAMGMGALLVHVGQGPMQIEMHFYFFVLLALLVVFADPLVIVAGALAILLHHAALFFLLPASLFNYQASFWAVIVHGLFVLLESVAACFVARSFFDSAVGLEQTVARRTEELARRTREVRAMLDNAGQGFVTFDLAGQVASERSGVLDRWLGPCPPGARIWSWIGQIDSAIVPLFELSWEAVTDDVLPLELTLGQMPRRVAGRGRVLELDYRPLFEADALHQVLLLVSDVTRQVEHEREEAEAREMIAVFEHLARDRAGFLDFLTEADELVGSLLVEREDPTDFQRSIHTLKGNCGMFGLTQIATLCHQVEDALHDHPDHRAPDATRALVDRWRATSTQIARLLGEFTRHPLEVSELEHASLLRRLMQGAPLAEIIETVEQWQFEPTELRLERLAAQARALAGRMNKPVEVQVEPRGVRVTRTELGPFWAALVHLVRNAVDHGLDTPEERAQAGKPPVASLVLSTRFEGEEFVLSVTDDGRGVDWEAVRLRAAARGWPSTTRRDLTEALFATGFSTRDTVSLSSGRGVGLAAVREACERMGGRVGLESRPGASTTIEARLPRARTRVLGVLASPPSVPELSPPSAAEFVPPPPRLAPACEARS